LVTRQERGWRGKRTTTKKDVRVAVSLEDPSSHVLGGWSELGATAALVAAFWRYKNLTSTNALLLESKVDEEEALAPTEEDIARYEEDQSLENISSLFLAALSCLPYLNWLPWLLMMKRGSSREENQGIQEGGGKEGYYYLVCALLYASPYLDLFGTRDLATSIDVYVLALGVAHLQLERRISNVQRDTRLSADQQWSDYDSSSSSSSSSSPPLSLEEGRDQERATLSRELKTWDKDLDARSQQQQQSKRSGRDN